MAKKIFISYRRDDSASYALNVAQYLERTLGSKNVFIDIDRIKPGQKFGEVLQERLALCKVLLCIIGPNWLGARDKSDNRLENPHDWVRMEVAQALRRNIIVIPVLVAGGKLPSKSELPYDLKDLVDHQAIEVTTTGFRNEMAGQVRDIRGIPGLSSWPRLGVGLVASSVVASGALVSVTANDPLTLMSLWSRVFHMLTTMVSFGLLVFFSVVPLPSFDNGYGRLQERMLSAAKWLRYATALGVASGTLLLVPSGYLFSSQLYGGGVYVPLNRVVILWSGVVGGVLVFTLIEATIWPNLRAILERGENEGKTEDAARIQVLNFSRLALAIAVLVTFGMVAASHYY
jgi:hypothetical protein